MAVLHMDSLVTKSNPTAILEAIKTLPQGIDAAYDQAIERMKSQSDEQWERAQLALVWTVHAQRPLHLEEFNHALTIRNGKPSISEFDVEDGEMFVSACAGLVIVEKGSQLVRLVRKCDL